MNRLKHQLAIGIALWGLGLAHSADLPDGAVALVNGKPITEQLLDSAMRSATSRGSTLSPLLRNAYLDGLIRTELLAQRAKQIGLASQSELAASLAIEASNLLIAAYRKARLATSPVTEEMLRSAHSQLKGQASSKQGLHAWSLREILLPSETAARTIIERLQAGEPFDVLALSESTDLITRSQAGTLGELYTHELPMEIRDHVARVSAPSLVATPIQTKAGWLVVYVDARREMKPMRYEEAVDSLRVTIEKKAWNSYVSNLIDETERSALPLAKRAIDNDRVAAILRADMARGAINSLALRNTIRKEVALQDMLSAQAKAAGVLEDPAVSGAIAINETRVLAGALESFWTERNPLTQAELRKEYERQVSQLTRGGGLLEYEVSQMIVRSKEAALDLLLQLNRGANFEELARAESIDPRTRGKGGYLGWILPLDVEPEIGGAIVAMEKDQISPVPIKTREGWHVIKLDDKRTYKAPSFEDSVTKLAQTIRANKWKGYVDGLTQKARITKN